MKLWRVRRSLYRGARIIPDIETEEKGPVGLAMGIERRWLSRIVQRLLRKA